MPEDSPEFRFTPGERRVLASVLDEIIPPWDEASLPGAGELGLDHYIEEVAKRDPELGQTLVHGIAALEALVADRSDSRTARDFASLPQRVRAQTLEALGSSQPAFLPSVIFHTYTGYYQNPRVLAAHGVAPRPPHPEGYDMGTDDLSLLDPVRARPPLYREP